MAREVVHQLLATDVALDKLGSRGISAEEAEQLLTDMSRFETRASPRIAASAFCLSAGRTGTGR